MFGLVKSWDNRKEAKAKKLPTTNGRTWTRRVQWLINSSGEPVKLKFWDSDRYLEVGVPEAFAQMIYDRFKGGQSAEDAVSVYKVDVQLSRFAAKEVR